jgi:O-antigen ligase
VSGVIVEAGIHFILLFTPFAFGGVEGWAIGVLQIVTGIVVAAWALDRLGQRGATPMRGGRAGRALWIPIGLFVLLVAAQLVPLPPWAIARVSPATHDLYETTLPGYAEGRPFEARRLVPWLLERHASDLPAPAADDPAEPALSPDLDASPHPRSVSPRRTLSIYPFDTRVRLTLFLCYAGLFAAALWRFRTPGSLERLCVVGCLSGAAVTLLGLAQKFTWNGKLYWIREGNYGQVFGPFVDRNTYAAFAGVWMPVAAGLALASIRRMRHGHRDEIPRVLLWGTAAVVMAGGIFVSLSRGGIVSASLSVVVLAGMLLYYGRARAEIVLLLALLAASMLFLVWLGPERVVERIGTLSEGEKVQSLQYRFGAWQRALPLVRDNALVGTGLGTFRFAYMRYAPPSQSWWISADNQYLELLCDVGVTGFLLFLWGAGAWIVRAGRPWRLRDRPERHMYIGIVAGLAGLALHSGVTGHLHLPANAVLIPVLGAALINLVAMAPVRREARPASASAGEPGTSP